MTNIFLQSSDLMYSASNDTLLPLFAFPLPLEVFDSSRGISPWPKRTETTEQSKYVAITGEWLVLGGNQGVGLPIGMTLPSVGPAVNWEDT